MKLRHVAFFFVIAVGLLDGDSALAADSPARTEWGDPDLRGVWSNASVTPLERPVGLGDKSHLTEEEARVERGKGLENVLNLAKTIPEGELTGELNEIWLEPPTEVIDSRRTSLIVEPADGRIPYTKEGRLRQLRGLGRRFGGSTAASHEDLHLGDRCLLFGILHFPNPFYLNTHQIFQTPDHVAIVSEYGPQTRIIPLDGQSTLDEKITQWNGSSRGRWEGDTLVVETKNYSGRGFFQGATAGLSIVERFKRVDENTIDYALTVTDPASFTQPWTLEHNLRTTEGPLFEFACHEGNYGLVNVLSGARAAERAALERDQRGE
jgi:hypothetical protein